MNFMKIFHKKDPVEYKQPQELYCYNYECLNLTAYEENWSDILDEHGISKAKFYCLDCIVKGTVE